MTDEPLVLTAVASLGRWRWRAFRRDVAKLHRLGHKIEVQEGRGLCERRFTVTAQLDVLNELLGDDN